MITIRHKETGAVLWEGQTLVGADLKGADLTGANLSGANLSKAYLWEADLSGADLTEANLSGAELSGANLRWAEMSGANLSRANLRWANLRWADLSRANLGCVNLSEANLSGADLRWADLSGTDLRWANLSESNLEEVKGLKKIMNVKPGQVYWKRFGAGLVNNGYQYKVGLNTLRPGEVFAGDERILCSYPGLHFASRVWCAEKYPDRPLEAMIQIPKGALINEPWATDGKASADRIEILQVWDTRRGEDVTSEHL